MKRFPIWTAAVVAAAALAHADAVYFSPRGGCEQALLDAIAAAEESIDVAMYIFTNPNIKNALLTAVNKGVRVRVILNEDQLTDDRSQGPWLAAAGCELRYRKPLTAEGDEGIMHLKIAIFDGKEAALGSYNWTKAAEKYNDEILIFTSNADIVENIKRHFDYLWRKAKPLPPAPPYTGRFVARRGGYLYHVPGCPFAVGKDTENVEPYDPTLSPRPEKKKPCPYCIK